MLAGQRAPGTFLFHMPSTCVGVSWRNFELWLLAPGQACFQCAPLCWSQPFLDGSEMHTLPAAVLKKPSCFSSQRKPVPCPHISSKHPGTQGPQACLSSPMHCQLVLMSQEKESQPCRAWWRGQEEKNVGVEIQQTVPRSSLALEEFNLLKKKKSILATRATFYFKYLSSMGPRLRWWQRHQCASSTHPVEHGWHIPFCPQNRRNEGQFPSLYEKLKGGCANERAQAVQSYSCALCKSWGLQSMRSLNLLQSWHSVVSSLMGRQVGVTRVSSNIDAQRFHDSCSKLEFLVLGKAESSD